MLVGISAMTAETVAHATIAVHTGIADPLLAATELVPTATTIRQMLNTLIHPPGRHQLPGLVLMPGLTTGLAHRPFRSSYVKEFV
jgi:hypothetical protein